MEALDEYKSGFSNYIDEIVRDKDSRYSGGSEAFARKVAEILINYEQLDGFNYCFDERTLGRSRSRIDGYWKEGDETTKDNIVNLVIVVYDVDAVEDGKTLGKAEADRYFSYLENFVEGSLEGKLETVIDDVLDAKQLAREIREDFEKTERFRFFIFTNYAVTSTLQRNIQRGQITYEKNTAGIDKQIWSLERLFELENNSSAEDIEVDFASMMQGNGLPCLKAALSEDGQSLNYDCYLAVIPGHVLSELYEQYGMRLLQSNVRSFLTAQGKVNKNIQLTIKDNPEKFFAFNNGIAVTAKEVTTKNVDGALYIASTKDFQIINGGQTTASLAYAHVKSKADLSKIFVQMKLTAISDKVDEEAREEFNMSISRTSNSQNKVSDSDLTSSRPFHRHMETVSKAVKVPALSGSQVVSMWYYERTRGQYRQEQMKMTPAEQKKFLLKYPKEHVITKTDISKMHNCWAQLPHIVSKGAQTNNNNFSANIDELWKDEKNKEAFNENYYKNICCLKLIEDFLSKAIPGQSWYKNAYRANVIYYTIALLRKFTDAVEAGKFSLGRIWKEQAVPESLGNYLLQIAALVYKSITDPNAKTQNVTQWCKKEDCWNKVQEDVKLKVPEAVIKDFFISKSEARKEAAEAKSNNKLFTQVDDASEVLKLGADEWKRLRDFALRHDHLTLEENRALGVAVKIPARMPNPYQLKLLLLFRKRMLDSGYSRL